MSLDAAWAVGECLGRPVGQQPAALRGPGRPPGVEDRLARRLADEPHAGGEEGQVGAVRVDGAGGLALPLRGGRVAEAIEVVGDDYAIEKLVERDLLRMVE